MLEKPFFHRLNQIADWILRIVTLNLFLVTSTLLIFTFYPGIAACYRLFKDWCEGESTTIFGGFWTYFKEEIKMKLAISTILILVLLVGIFSMISYNAYIKEDAGLIYLIGYYVVLIFIIGFVMTTLFTIPIMIYFKNISLKNIYKLALYIFARYFPISLLVSILWIVPFVLLLIPSLMVIYVVAGLSLTILLWVLVSRPIFKFLKRIQQHD